MQRTQRTGGKAKEDSERHRNLPRCRFFQDVKGGTEGGMTTLHSSVSEAVKSLSVGGGDASGRNVQGTAPEDSRSYTRVCIHARTHA